MIIQLKEFYFKFLFMKKILWFSNVVFKDEAIVSTGTWLVATGSFLVESGEIELYNVSYGDVNEPVKYQINGITQWVVPRNTNSKFSSKEIVFFKEIEAQIKPDLIHIWGTENNWGVLAINNYFQSPIVLDIQGILYAYAKTYYGDLSVFELLKCIGIKEVLRPKNLLYNKQKDFVRRGALEQSIIKNVTNISVQSEWVKAHIKSLNNTCKVFDTRILLRKEFYRAKKWDFADTSEDVVIFSLTSGSVPYKGMHVLIRAFAEIRKQYPNARLRIAGNYFSKKSYFRSNGYSKWLMSLAKGLKVDESIEWLGSIDVTTIISELSTASLVVIPSMAETYCLALAEAMYIGVPTVVSYSGAMTEMAVHGESAMYFSPGDYMSCSIQIKKILDNQFFAKKLSLKAIEVGTVRNNPNDFLSTQLNIYNSLIG